MTYCANCETKAVYVIVQTDTPLCETCQNAYLWGQAGSDKQVIELEVHRRTRYLVEIPDLDQPHETYYEYKIVKEFPSRLLAVNWAREWLGADKRGYINIIGEVEKEEVWTSEK